MNRTKIEASHLASSLADWQRGRGSLKTRLKDALVARILNGELLSGEQLPPERALASALAVSRNTVVGAYELLREDGFLETRRASGSIIRFNDGGKRIHEHRARAIRETVAIGDSAMQPGNVIDFAVADVGLPQAFDRYVRAFEPERVRAAHADVTYSAHGLPELREALSTYYSKRGLRTTPEQILITSGGQQAISLALALHLQRGDMVAVQNPTFFIALDALRMAGARLCTLGQLAASRMAYVIPTYHNPTGETLSVAERESLASTIDDLGIPTIEDTVLEELGYDGAVPPPLASLSRTGSVMIAGSLNKVFWSGLRVGWIRANAGVIEHLARLKTVTDLGNNVISQNIALSVLSDWDRVREYRRNDLREKFEFTAALLDRHLPSWNYSAPKGGFCLWLRLPADDARPYVQLARRFGANIIAGSSMTIDDSNTDRLRLVFSGPQESTAEGIARLARAWQMFSSRGYAAQTPASALVV